MKVVIAIITKGIVDPRVMAAAEAQGCEVVVNKLDPIKMHDDYQKNRYMNSVRNRNVLRKKLVKRKTIDKVLMCDDDVVLPSDALEKMLAPNLPVVGGWYKMHSGDDWICGKIVEPETRTIHMYTQPKKEQIEVDLMGPGCCLIDREILEKIEFDAGIDSYCRSSRGHKTFEGDSFNFTQKIKALGFKPTMINVVCEHLPIPPKNYKIEENLFEKIVRTLMKDVPGNIELLYAIRNLTKE